MDNSNVTFALTTEWKGRIIQKGGTKLNVYGLRSGDREKLRDNNVLDILNNDVNAEAVTRISLTYCTGITNATLMCIADKCTQLETLHVNGCDKISDDGITDIAKKNNKLRTLRYSYCTRVTDAALEVITNECPQLERLYAAGCGHSKLPFDFGTKLPNLTVLNLENNNISTIPESLGQLADKCKLYISGNPLQQPPPEIAERGFEAIARYYQELHNGSTISNEQKIVILGHGEAGKTSLIQAILDMNQPLTKQEDRTIYVDLKKAHIPRTNESDLIAALFDFAGQGKYSAAQAQMITKSALYLLAVNADETDPHNYLRHLDYVQAKAPGSPVQIVLTKTDLLLPKNGVTPEEKGEEVRDIIMKRVNEYQKHIERKKDNKGTGSGSGSGTPRLLHVLQEVVMTSVKKDPRGSKMRMIEKILELANVKDPEPLLRTIGQPIPNSWINFFSAMDARRYADASATNDELYFN
jgi:GTPase SAR1 family protein